MSKEKIDRFKISCEGFGDLNYDIKDDGEWCDADDVINLENKIEKLKSEKAELIESIKYIVNNGVFESGQVRNEICNILNKFKEKSNG